MGATRASFPRFRRPAAATPVEITEDDIAIMRHLLRHRFVRTSDLYRLMSHRSPDKVSRRLARLYRARFVDRPLSQIDSFRGAGSQPLVYGLDNAGARFLAEHAGIDLSHGDWSRRNRRYTRENLDHTLAITAFMVELEVACRARADVDLIRLEDLAPGVTGRWSVTLPWHGSKAPVLIAPDAIFGLRVNGPDGRALRSFYFLEVDRGSMTISPSESVRRSDAFLYRSSILRKLFAYAISHQQKAHPAQLTIPVARVLLLTTKPSRAEEMRQAAQALVVGQLGVPNGLFLFGTTEGGDPLQRAFVDVARQADRLAGMVGAG